MYFGEEKKSEKDQIQGQMGRRWKSRGTVSLPDGSRSGLESWGDRRCWCVPDPLVYQRALLAVPKTNGKRCEE